MQSLKRYPFAVRKVFLVIEEARYDDSSYVVAAYATRAAAAKKVERRERDDDGYSNYRVREIPLLGLPNALLSEPLANQSPKYHE